MVFAKPENALKRAEGNEDESHFFNFQTKNFIIMKLYRNHHRRSKIYKYTFRTFNNIIFSYKNLSKKIRILNGVLKYRSNLNILFHAKKLVSLLINTQIWNFIFFTSSSMVSKYVLSNLNFSLLKRQLA